MKITPNRRKFQIRREKGRKVKLNKLKAKYFSAKTTGEKEKLILKFRAVSPSLNIEEYLGIKK
jgi:hypothetical protein